MDRDATQSTSSVYHWIFFQIQLQFSYFVLFYKRNAGINEQCFELLTQIYISDDTFLAVAATVQSVVNGVGRITWGFIFDYLGYRKTMLCITSGTAFFTLTFVCLPFLESNVTGAKVC